MSCYPHLFAPITLAGTYFRNRIFASPVSQPDISDHGNLRKDNIAFYGLRAKGGAASVSTGDGVVHSETGYLHPYKLRLDNPDIYPSLTDLTRTIRQYGAVPTLELSHGGKFANVPNLIGDMHSHKKAYGPDHEFNQDGVEIFEMPEELILEIVAAYGKAATRAKAAGFGMIMIHAGHGWLLNQFMSAATNHRTDRFGGSLENRMRFSMLAIQAVRDAVGPNFPIEFRMSGAQFTEGGYGIEEGVEIAKMIDGKVDLIHVSAGFHDNKNTFIITHPSMFHKHGCNVWLAGEIKKHVKTPVATVGGLSDPAMMEEIIASGQADVVELGRELMADPYMPKKAALGRDKDIVKCIRCFTCMGQLQSGRNMRCAINPAIGRETDPAIAPAPEKKRVLVAGGGPAGLQAALSAARRGHEVILCEAAPQLGGQLNCERYVPFKADLYDYARTLARQAEAAGVDIRLSTPVTPDLAASLHPDVILAALGGTFRLPDIPGIHSPKVVTAEVMKDAHPPIGDTVVVLGAGLVGCENAAHFAAQGKRVTLVGHNPDFAKDAPFPHKLALTQQLKDVTMHLGTSGIAVTEEGLVCRRADGTEFTVPADTVFCAAGIVPRRAEAEALRPCAPEFQVIGDNLAPGQLFAATTGGHYAGLEV